MEERRHDNAVLIDLLQSMLARVEERILDKIAEKEKSLVALIDARDVALKNHVDPLFNAFADKDMQKHAMWHRDQERIEETKNELKATIRKAFIGWGLPILLTLLLLLLKEPVIALLSHAFPVLGVHR